MIRSFRRFASTFGQLSRLMREAEQVPANTRKQAQLFNALLDNNQYAQIIERFESGSYSLNSECARAYVEALNRTGQGEKALKSVLNGTRRAIEMPQMNPLTPKPAPSRSAEQPYEHARFDYNGTKENPIHVISRSPTPTTRDRFWAAVKLTFGAWLALAIYTTYSEEMSKVAGRNFSLFNEHTTADSSSNVTFADVEGIDEVKDELKEIVEFLRDPGKFTKLGGKLPKGVLLTGPPGTGKTLLARAIAGEAGVPFFLCSGSEFDEMFVGVGAKRVRELFANAKKNSPCIIFIDEIDAVGSMRNPKDQQYAKMTLNQLLVELDGFSQTSGIIVIGATNFPELLDKALVRPGRFDRNVVVPLPDVNGRRAILNVHTREVPLDKDVKLSVIARATPGFSGAELANLINQAALRAAAAGKKAVTMSDIEWARDRIIMGAEKKNAVISEKNRRMVAFHEAGHALVAIYTPGSLPIHKATIMPRGAALGMVSQLPDDDELNWTRQQLRARIDVAMGGRCAEELIFGDEEVSSGASSDIDQATRVASAMICKLGMGSGKVGKVLWSNTYETLSPETRTRIEDEVRSLIDEGYTRAMSILKTNREELERLAAALLEYETLSKEEIDIVIKGGKLKRKPVDDRT